MKLRQIEADVLEYLRQGKSPAEIGSLIGKTKMTGFNIIGRLRELGAVERKIRGVYVCSATEYEIVSDKVAGKPRSIKKKKPILPDGYEFYIRGHYDKIPRSELARRLQMRKVDLNMVLIQLGFGREKPEKEEKYGA